MMTFCEDGSLSFFTLNQQSLCGAVTPVSTIHGSENQRVEVGVTPLTIALRRLFEEFVLPSPTIFRSCGSVDPSFQKEDSSTREQRVRLNLIL